MFPSLTRAQTGMLAMITACIIWGLSSLFYKSLASVPPLEVLAHRTIWSLVFFIVVLAIQRRLKELGQALIHPRILGPIAAAALAISLNWFGFIASVQSGYALEASLGYYSFPLLAVLMGVILFGDRLGAAQGIAVGLATFAVLVLTVGLGAAPWIALFLATSFVLYGIFKKLSPLGPVVSTGAEVAVLSPIALIWIFGVHEFGWIGPSGRSGGHFGDSLWISVGLILSGPLTGLPLLLFSYASKRIRLSTLGLIQYVNPTLQFLIAVMVFGEPFTIWHQMSFALIWAALAIYSIDSLRAGAKPPAT